MAMRSMRMIFVIAEAVVISIMTAMTAVAPMIHTMIMTITIRMDMMTIMITMMMIMNMRSGQGGPGCRKISDLVPVKGAVLPPDTEGASQVRQGGDIPKDYMAD